MSRIVEGAGVEIAYQERGSGPTVVLVHGIGDCGEGGQAIAAPLASRARVVTYDRRGYGGSGSPQPYGATTVQEQAEDLAALIEAVGVAPVVLCGFDFGKGVCGKAWETKQIQMVDDVDAFPGHIACSSLSRSEIVLPIFNSMKEVVMVLDIDSDKVADFDETDKKYLQQVIALIERAI